MDATLHVFTYKEGLLSRLAHDLRLSLTQFEVSLRGAEVSARMEPSSLRVDGVVQAGQLKADEPSPADKQKIHQSLVQEVLHLREHPELSYSGRVTNNKAPFVIEGTLTLHGKRLPLAFQMELRGGRLHADIPLVPSRWGIKPFRALGGALKVRDAVRVTVDASAQWLPDGDPLNPALELTWSPSQARG